MIQLKEFCGMCRSHSWCGRECRNAPGLPVQVAKTPLKIQIGGVRTPAAITVELPAPNEPPKLGQRLIQAAKEASEMARDGTAFDKAVYQRDYMRKKRAKEEATLGKKTYHEDYPGKTLKK